MKRLLNTIAVRSEFARNVATLITGTALAQVINLGFNMYLARMYAPEFFGSWALYMSVVTSVFIVACARFDIAIVAVGDDTEAEKLLSLATGLTLLCSALCLFLLFISYIGGFSILPSGLSSAWQWYIPLSVIFLTLTQVFWMWNVRRKTFRNIAWIRILEPLIIGLLAVYYYNGTADGLLWSNLAGQLFTLLSISIITFKIQGISLLKYSFAELWSTGIRFIEYPKVNIPQSFLDLFQTSAIVLLLSEQFSARVVGFYSLCMRVLYMPSRLIIMPMAQVFFSEASSRYSKGEDLYPLVKKTLWRTVLMTLPIPLFLLIAGPYLFALVFGDQWEEAGAYARILVPFIWLDFVRIPIAQVAPILNKQRMVLFISFAAVAMLALLVMYFGWVKNDIFATVLSISLSQAVFMIILIIYLLHIAKNAMVVAGYYNDEKGGDDES